ncbi:protein kinase [Streptomyces sp. NPDC096048]|uniref:protein kinase domain-containing protein n=1 Tax=Streptomyces sp. NPDC096048 TaxID=3366072 RepID=UPI00380705A5
MASRCSADVLCGRYRLDGLVGSGGAADVHRGFDLRLRRSVAVKIFRPDTGCDIDEASHDEAVILAQLHHPGLVSAYDAGRHNGRVFLVMQLIEGDTLKNHIAKAPLSPAATAAVGVGLAQALAHAHEAGIVHRDVKPSNILLDASHHPYLTDFGISRLLDATTRTATGTLIGTAAYLSPEQVLGRPVGRPADVYALGLVLLECLTGRLEYDGGPLEAAIARLHRQPVLPHCLPEQMAALLRAMTSLDEQDRPSARDCARALTELADSSKLGPVPPSPSLSIVPRHEASRTADHDRTHLRPPAAGDRTAPGTAPARRRALAASATVTLAAVITTALTVTDDSASPGNDRSATRVTSTPTAEAPAEETDPPRAAHQKEAASPSVDTAPPSDRGAAAGALPRHDTGRRAPSSPHGPNTPSDISAATNESAAQPTQTTQTSRATPSDTSTSPAPTRSETMSESPNQPPGQAKKTRTARPGDPPESAKSPTTGRQEGVSRAEIH